jgi:hypothetical protein
MWRFAHRSPACSARVALTFRHVTVSTCGCVITGRKMDFRIPALTLGGGGDLDPVATVVGHDDHRIGPADRSFVLYLPGDSASSRSRRIQMQRLARSFRGPQASVVVGVERFGRHDSISSFRAP